MGSVKFKHFRMVNVDGSVSPRDGLTIAWVENPDGHVIFGSSKCHPDDNFVKRLGRVRAFGRLKGSNAVETTVDTEKFLNIISDSWKDYVSGKLEAIVD